MRERGPVLGPPVARPGHVPAGGHGPFFASRAAKASSLVSPLRKPLERHLPSRFLWRKSKTITTTVVDGGHRRVPPGHNLGFDAARPDLHRAWQRGPLRPARRARHARRGRARNPARLPAEVGRPGRLTRDRLPARDPADLDRVGLATRPARLVRQRSRLQLLPDPAAAPLHDRRRRELGGACRLRDRGGRQQHGRRAGPLARGRGRAWSRAGRPRPGRARRPHPRARPHAGGGDRGRGAAPQRRAEDGAASRDLPRPENAADVDHRRRLGAGLRDADRRGAGGAERGDRR